MAATDMTELGVVLPPGVDRGSLRVEREGPRMDRGMVVNETDLPDSLVMEAVGTYFEENASVMGANQGTTFQSYANEGSLLARAKYRTPGNVIDEITLARDLAERDDDVAATMGAILATAFGEGMQHAHSDETVVGLFDKLGEKANLDLVFMEMLREWLIAFQVNTVTVWTRESLSFTPPGGDRQRTRQVVVPRIGVLPAELIRVIDNDIFRTGTLAYKPATGKQERWLEEFFSESTSPGRKAEMRKEDPVLAAMLVERLSIQDDHVSAYGMGAGDPPLSNILYRLNPRMVHRTAAPKGAWRYPRPPMTRNFALLEAKRLLNLMDYALLQGGANFLVVAKKGSDQRPAMPEEIGNLRDTIKRATRTGVVIGDHRLTIEIITPNLTELLNAEKRKLLATKISRALLRLPEIGDGGGGEETRADVELMSRVISSDRRLMRRHVENEIYEEAVKRNSGQFPNGAASIWFPKIVLQGLNYFTDLVLKLRDRGDIPRKYAVEAGGFNYEAGVQQRKREKASGDDRALTPAAVPFNAPGAGSGGPDSPPRAAPTDNASPGRPRGSGPNNGAPGARRRATEVASEQIRVFEDAEEGTVRCGEGTWRILEQFPEREVGRITADERAYLEQISSGDYTAARIGSLHFAAVNGDYDLIDVRAVRLRPGLTMYLGYRAEDHAMAAQAFSFRTPDFDVLDAEEHALSWGFPTEFPRPQRELPPGPEPIPEELARREREEPTIIVMPPPAGARFRTVLDRDDDGNVTGTHQEPIEDPA